MHEVTAGVMLADRRYVDSTLVAERYAIKAIAAKMHKALYEKFAEYHSTRRILSFDEWVTRNAKRSVLITWNEAGAILRPLGIHPEADGSIIGRACYQLDHHDLSVESSHGRVFGWISTGDKYYPAVHLVRIDSSTL